MMNVDSIGERHIKAPARALMIGREDNVALLLGDVKAGDAILLNGSRITVAIEDIPAGYKIAVVPLNAGQTVVTQSEVIGVAMRAIQPGERVHFHNLNAA